MQDKWQYPIHTEGRTCYTSGMQHPKDVDEYIQRQPEALQPRLRKLRETIQDASPQAEEKISYGMPYYVYKGRVAYFELFKHHIGLYIPSPIIAEFKEELEGYEAADATIRLPLDKEIPFSLVHTMIKARVKKNEENHKDK